MPWPKGVPRKGHINADGTTHKIKGKKMNVIVLDEMVPAEAQLDVADPPTASPYDITQMHGMVGSGAITQVCPKCAYAYADGGYCSECGWSKAISRAPYGTYSGQRP
jgi:hypothetical protein